MKTILVSLILATALTPAAVRAQARDGSDGKPGPRDGDGRRPPPGKVFADAWKGADTDGDGFISLAEFEAMPRLKNLPEEKRANLFKRLDKNGDGKLSREELGRMGGRPQDQGRPMQRLWELDKDRSGGVSFEEFKAGEIFGKLPPEKLLEVFRRLDTNGDGMISPQDRPVHPFRPNGGKGRGPDGDKSKGEDRPGKGGDRSKGEGKPGKGGDRPKGQRGEPQQLIRQLDKDGDGALSFEEFRKWPAVRDLGEDAQENRFMAMDKNGDLKLTRGDFPPPPPRKD